MIHTFNPKYRTQPRILNNILINSKRDTSNRIYFISRIQFLLNQHEEVEGEEILITWIITGYSPKRRDRLQSIIQILRRAGSISLSRARHSPGNDQEPDGKDERHFVRHFGGRHHRFTSRRTRKLSSSGVSVACYSYARLMINRRSHADKRSLDLSFSLSLSERFQRRIAIDTTIGSTIMVLDRLDAR